MKIEYILLSDLDIKNSFFDSLRNDYDLFDSWYIAKAEMGEQAYVAQNEDGEVEGFLYLKIEDAQSMMSCHGWNSFGA